MPLFSTPLSTELYDRLPLGITIYELISRDEMDFRCIYVNRRASEMIGFDLNMLIGQSLRTLVPAAYQGLAEFPRTMLQALDTQSEIAMGLTTYVDSQLGAILAETSCMYVSNKQVAIIAKEAKSETSLSEKLSLQRQMLEHGEKTANICTWVINQRSQELSFTGAFCDLYDLEPQEANSGNARNLILTRIHPEDRGEVELMRTASSDRLPLSATYRYRTKEGTYIWLKETLDKQLPEGSLIGTTRNVTETKLREEKLSKALHFQEKIMLTTPEIVYVYDIIEHKNVFANKSIISELGFTEEEVQEMGDQMLVRTIHPEDLPKVINHHQNTLPNLKTGETVQLEYRSYSKRIKNYIWLESTESVFERNEEGKVHTIIGLARVIQDKKQAEMEVRQTNEELQQLVYSVSHDLRAPVRHIEGYADLVREEDATNLSEEGKHRLDRVISSAHRLGSMIDALLAYSRTRNASVNKSYIEVETLLANMLQTFKDSNPKQKISWTLGDLPGCYADRRMFTQIWENLISNAIKYSSKKESTLIEIDAESREEEIIYQIRDHGCGFNQDYSDKLFAVFQRLHTQRQYPGHGIGLANVARMVKLHAGKVWAESILDEGAIFYISLPTLQPNE